MKVLSLAMAIVLLSTSALGQQGVLVDEVPVDCVGGLPDVKIKDGVGGKLTITNKDIEFTSSKGEITISADDVTKISGGQYAKRRVKSAVISGILLSPVFLFALVGKKKRDILLIEYKDDSSGEPETNALILRYKPKNGRALAIERAIESATGVKIEKEVPPDEK